MEVGVCVCMHASKETNILEHPDQKESIVVGVPMSYRILKKNLVQGSMSA